MQACPSVGAPCPGPGGKARWEREAAERPRLQGLLGSALGGFLHPRGTPPTPPVSLLGLGSMVSWPGSERGGKGVLRPSWASLEAPLGPSAHGIPADVPSSGQLPPVLRWRQRPCRPVPLWEGGTAAREVLCLSGPVDPRWLGGLAGWPVVAIFLHLAK